MNYEYLRPWRARASGLSFALLSTVSCIPVDARDPPGTVTVEVQAAPALPGARFETADGFQLEFERFVVALGRTSLAGDDCNAYSSGEYTRLFDFTTTSERHKLSLLYGLGSCELSFAVTIPGRQALLESGVTEADRIQMRAAASDAYEENRGVSLYVQGRAQQGAREKRFAFAFRSRLLFEACKPNIELSAERAAEVLLRVDALGLFRERAGNADARLRFAPFADADDVLGNADGVVTQEELDQSPLGADAVENQGQPRPFASLGEYLYRGAAWGVFGYADGGSCELVRRDDD